MTKQAALTLLKEKRSNLIQEARKVAVALCNAKGSTNIREVYNYLKNNPVLIEAESLGIDRRWLGAVFSTSQFSQVGTTVTGNDSHRGTNSREIGLWSLKGTKLPSITYKELKKLQPLLLDLYKTRQLNSQPIPIELVKLTLWIEDGCIGLQ